MANYYREPTETEREYLERYHNELGKTQETIKVYADVAKLDGDMVLVRALQAAFDWAQKERGEVRRQYDRAVDISLGTYRGEIK